MARMGHAVELIEQRPFLGGRAARSARCSRRTTAASACRRPTPRPAHESAFIATSPSTTPTCTSGVARWSSPSPAPRRLRGQPASTAQHRHPRLHQLQHVRDVCRQANQRLDGQGDLRRVLRRPRVAHDRPGNVHLLRRLRRPLPRQGHRLQAVVAARHRQRGSHPDRRRLRPAPARFISYLGYGRPAVVTQTELSR